MKNISVNNNGIDILKNLLYQSKLIKAQSSNVNNTSVSSSQAEEVSQNPRVSLKNPDTDVEIMLSQRGRNISQKIKDDYIKEIKKYIEDILNSLTEQDYKMLAQEGYQVEDLTVDSLLYTIQLIKNYEKEREAESEDQSDQKKDSNLSDDVIKEKMKENNLPVTKESVDRVKGALKLSEEIPNMDKNDALYLLKNNLPPTTENLYKARYSKQNKEAGSNLPEEAWQELIPQVTNIIGSAGFTCDEETLEDARWLIENDLPITGSNLNFLKEYKELTETYDKEMVFDRMMEGMKEGELPGNVALFGQDVFVQNENAIDEEKIEKLVGDIQKNYDDEIVKVVKENREITIKNLTEAKEADEEAEEISLDELTDDQILKVISARRQLEEIRLKMTLEAARRLEKKGFSIDTRPLEEVVEKLRYEEERYYKELYRQAGIEADEEKLRLLQSTAESVEELKVTPSYVLGATLYDKKIQTVSNLLSEGRNMLTELEKAKEAYEPLLTQPRSDFGDSIQKAFNNMDSLMEEMGIEDTVYNRRAVRILAYNQMEISKESIEQIKDYDLKVNYMLQNLNPKVAVQMIKEGINPLDIPIDELNDRIESINEKLGYHSIDKYSTYLYKLEKESAISESEKKAYIGIYRLLYQIEKSDGAALGALIKADRDVTLNHLLSAIRSQRKTGMDYKVDDEFGTLEDVSLDKETITDQLGAVYNNENSYSTEQEIQKSIVKQLLDNLTPAKLHYLHQNLQDELTGSAGNANVWNTLGDIPIENLLDQIKDISPDTEDDQGYYYEKLNELRQVFNNCDNAIRFLSDFKLPCTANNLIMAEQLISNDNTLFKKIFKSQNPLKKNAELSDKLIDKKTMNDAYDELEEEVNNIIEEESKEEGMDSFRLGQLKTLGMQMHFVKTLATREFYRIPIEISGEITNINLTIVRGKPGAGKVTVTLTSDGLGSIKAEATLKDNMLSGYVACDHADSLKLLESQTENLKSSIEKDNLVLKQLNFCLQQAPENIHGYQDNAGSEGGNSRETELILYRVAKSMISMIKSAEEAKVSHMEVAEGI